MTAIASTSGRLHREFIRLLFLQSHRETDRFFFTSSGVQLPEHNSGLFHFRRTAYSVQIKAKCGNLLAKTATLRINLNLDGAPITSKSHTHPSYSETSCVKAYSRGSNIATCPIQLDGTKWSVDPQKVPLPRRPRGACQVIPQGPGAAALVVTSGLTSA
jgi:hypothetical protein